MVAPRSLYRALGAEHVRHRREAPPTVLLRRLLSLDYVLDHLAEPWLATEAEKVSALTTAGAPEEALPRRVYRGRRDSRSRYFAHKLPLALEAGRATFVFVQAEDVTPSGVRTWGETHAGLWAAFARGGARGRRRRGGPGPRALGGGRAGARRLDVECAAAEFGISAG